MPTPSLDAPLGDYFDGLLLGLVARSSPPAPRLRVTDTAAAYIVTAAAPGVALKDVAAAVREGLLTLRAPGFYRTAYLSEPVDAARLTSTLAGGVLTVTLPRL